MGSSSYFCNTYGKHNDAVERDRAHHPPTRPNKKINNRTKSSRNFAKVFAINGLLVMIVRGSHGVTVSRFEAAVLNLCLCQIYVISYVCLLLRIWTIQYLIDEGSFIFADIMVLRDDGACWAAFAVHGMCDPVSIIINIQMAQSTIAPAQQAPLQKYLMIYSVFVGYLRTKNL